MLDRKRSNTDDYENTTPNKRVLLSSNTPATITNTNCTVINISATNVSELASVIINGTKSKYLFVFKYKK